MPPSNKSKRETDLTSLVSQLQDLAGQIRQQVDHELARLERSRRLADQASERLETLLTKIQPKVRPCPEGPQDTLPQMNINVSQQHSLSVPHGQGSLLAKHQEVYDLLEKGLGPLEIAQQTGQTVGEVQVILALRKFE